FHPDGHFIVSTSVDKTVRLWELVARDGNPGHGHVREVWAVALSRDGKLMATGGVDRTVKVWDAATGAEKFTLTGHGETITALAFTPDGKPLVSASEGQLKVWDTANGKEVRTITDIGAKQVPVVTVTEDNKRIVAWVANTIIESYKVEDGSQIDSWSAHSSNVTCLAFSADGTMAALGTQEGLVRVWDVINKKKLEGGDLPAHEERVTDLTFTPDKKTLITAGRDG